MATKNQHEILFGILLSDRRFQTFTELYIGGRFIDFGDTVYNSKYYSPSKKECDRVNKNRSKLAILLHDLADALIDNEVTIDERLLDTMKDFYENTSKKKAVKKKKG